MKRHIPNLLAVALALTIPCLHANAAFGAEGALRFDFSSRKFAPGGAVKTLLIPPTDSKPVIDGKLGDELWKQAPALTVEPSSGANRPFHLRAAYDSETLYLAVTCDGAPTKAEPAERDANVWTDDCVEIWASSGSGRRRRIYHFIVNAVNAVYDSAAGDRAYNPDWRHATGRTPKGWVLEAAIPRAALGLRRWDRRLPLNVGRNGPTTGYYAWADYGSTGLSALEFQGVRPAAGKVEKPAALAPLPGDVGATLGDALDLRLERTTIPAGERYAEVPFRLRAGETPLGRLRLESTVHALGGGEPLGRAECRPTRLSGRLVLDMRRLGLPKAAVGLTLRDGQRVLGRATVLLSAKAPSVSFRKGERAKILLDPPKGAKPDSVWPVTFGAPFPAGALWDASRVRLVDARGREVPHQKEASGLWGPDGSVKWLRFDALVNPGEGACYVEAAPSTAAAAPAPALALREQGDAVVIDTGASRYVLGKGASPIRQIWRGGRLAATAEGARGLYVVNQKGRLAAASAKGETMEVEARGPVAACVRFEGFYRDAKGKPLARHITRVECFAGRADAKITHTLVMTNDTNKVWFREVGWEFAAAPGASPAAWFGADRDAWDKTQTVPLRGAASGAFMIQDEHYRFAKGKNHSLVAALDPAGKTTAVREGKEMGDWAALLGRDGGVLMGCREAARQHPKEFEIGRSRITLKLYSPRAGEELDFRAPAVAERCNFEGWHKVVVSKRYRDAKWMQRVKKLASNALGWAKTHELWIEALPPAADMRDASRRSFLRSRQVYAHVDPKWLRRTEVMGKLHPRDPERFPDMERVASLALDFQISRDAEFGEYGFMYYGCGPHIGYRGKYPVMKRWKSTYCVREAVWLMYARSADRRIREFAFRTNRGMMDYYMINHDGKRKVKGAFVRTQGGDAGAGDNPSCLPFPWQGGSTLGIATTTHLDPFLWMYHIAGDRRARDVVVNYGEAVKKMLRPHLLRGGRPFQILKAVAQTYTLTWDPTLRAAADTVGDHLYMPGGVTDVTDEKPGGVYYKLTSDLPGLIQIARVFGSRRYYDMALKSAVWRWYVAIPAGLLGYGYTLGYVGPWLYEQNGDPTIAEWLRVRLREAPTQYDPKKGRFIDPHAYCGAYNYLFLRDFPFVQDLLLRTGALKKPVSAWAAYEPFGSETSVFLKKTDKKPITVWLRNFGGKVEVRREDGSALNFPLRYEVGRTQVLIPMEAKNGVYEIVSSETSRSHVAMADEVTAFVIRAPEYWRPFPAETPPRRVFFGVPKGEKEGRIFFERPARLYDPEGKPFGGDVKGWASLPPDKPGTWSFQLTERGLVKVENLPPFFAMRSAERYFTPKVTWDRAEERPEPKAVSKKSGFVPGAIQAKGDQALYVAGRRRFTMPAGPKHRSGDGTVFLPLSEGTIEFFYKPTWSTFDMSSGTTVKLVAVTSRPRGWYLQYHMRPSAGRHYVYNLYGVGWRDGKWKAGTIRCYRRPTLIEKDKWIHVAWTWSREKSRRWGFTSLRMVIYVNGRQGTCYGNGARYSHMTGVTRLLELGSGGAYDELRISDVRRYRRDFEPPSRSREMEPDDHTRALFHFNGDLKGLSASTRTPIQGKLK